MAELPRVPIGRWIDSAVEWLEENAEWVFDYTSDFLSWLIELIESFLMWPNPLILTAAFAAFAWWVRSKPFALFTVLAFPLIDSMRLWEQAMSSLALVLVASVIAVAVGVPLGIAATRSPLVSRVTRPALDFMQTMPAFVYLIPAIVFFGLGEVPGVVATVVFSLPPSVRLTELGIRQVDPEVVEAGHAFGSPPRQILTRIQIPLALPTIMAGINQVIMLALSMVVIAGIVGAGGLGAVVLRGITTLDVGRGFEGGLAIVILAIFLDRSTSSVSERAFRRQHAGN
ncbi:MAG: proline/glycine betaine ABC transporter permease [Acidimicrobiia bacterium]|nr:proline/glycine betaine ABC transporter permease [Acidimicrobiia bacterium]